MPPQPISKIAPKARISFNPYWFLERPEVAAGIGQCIMRWATVETQVSHIFTVLAGLNSEAGVELYNAFGGASLKDNSIKVLARSRLEPSDCKIIEALLKVVQSHQKIRDKIAHWYWGMSDDIPDGLILIDPKYLLARHARFLDFRKKGQVPLFSIDLEKIYVYRVSDLEVDANAFMQVAELVRRCYLLCSRTGEKLVALRDELSKHDLLAPLLVRSSSADR
jgi:hypothetical protein